MTTYSVTIYETIHHTLEIEADSPNKAQELAHELYCYSDPETLKKENNYQTEADGFTDYRVDEVVITNASNVR